MKRTAVLLPVILLLVASTGRSHAMDAADFGQFQQLMQMPPSVLADKASTILDRKYPETINFNGCCADVGGGLLQNALPTFIYTSKATEIAYQIAIKKPDLLARQFYYGEEHHRNLLECFLIDGKEGAYNEHGAKDAICYTEALLTFLWSEIGSSHDDIAAGLRMRFDPAVNEPPPFTP